VGNEAIGYLSELPHLKRVGLQNTQITDESFLRLVAPPDLHRLDVMNTKVSRDALNRFRSQRPDVQLFPN
jgi:hypothetical protein